MKKIAGVLACCLSGVAWARSPIVVEAESFRSFGGWVNDTQFMDQMGSPYLLAHGFGTIVADAETSVSVAEGGTYRAYVRTKNWAAPWQKGRTPNDSVGRFQLLVNGQAAPTVLGREGSGEWLWSSAGEVTLRAGENALTLKALDGFDARCDVIVFTKDAADAATLDGLRREALARCAQTSKDYDFVVVGGGVSGMCAAISAARLGLHTALVQDRPVLGGNNSTEIRVGISGWVNMPPYPRLGDVVDEIGPRRGGNAEEPSRYQDARKMNAVLNQKNLDLYLNEHVNRVEKDADGAIRAVVSQNTRSGARTRFAAPLFADCTGDGTVGYLAGADWRMGREDKAAHNEPLAPEKADSLTMGASVMWYSTETFEETSFPLQDWMIPLNDSNAKFETRGDWIWEAGLGRDQIAEAEFIRDYGLLVVYSTWGFVKNVSEQKDKAKNRVLEWVAYNAGRRESRRLMGDFIVTENDILDRVVQPDGTCPATWTIDLHYPLPAEKTGYQGEPYKSYSTGKWIWPYAVPYRSLYSRNVPNLLMAGRHISVTHVALGATRVMRTTGMMGEVIGMAASLCKKFDCRPRQIYTDHLEALKAQLTKGAGDGRIHPPQTYGVHRISKDPSFNRGQPNHQRQVLDVSSFPVDEKGIRWIDGTFLPLEGKVFDDTARPYDRLPVTLTTNVNAGVHRNMRDSAGLQFRFTPHADQLHIRWQPLKDLMAMDHMPSTGVAAIDIYRQNKDGVWEYVKTGRIHAFKGGGKVSLPWESGTPCLVNLPLYNGIESFSLGVASNATVAAVPPRKNGVDRPVVFYGTSITQGACASRPGMSYVNIIGRRLDVPVVNLGFNGSGRMEFEMSEHLAAIDASCYVLDCLWNMSVAEVRTRYEPFIRNLRRQRPDVPIVMVEKSHFANPPREEKDRVMRALYERLVAEGWKNLYYVQKADMLPGDGEGTVDGVHPNDYGMMRYAEAQGAVIKEALGL